MKTKLDEKFIVHDVKNRNEYIEKINLFINQYQGLRPETHSDSYEVQGFKRNKEFIRKYGLTLLDERYFSKKHLSTGYSLYFITYSSLLRKNVIVFNHGGYWGRNYIILTEETPNVMASLTVVRRLYKILVTEVIDQSNLLRKIKCDRDIVMNACKFKYHYCPTSGKGLRIESCTLNIENNQVVIKLTPINLKHLVLVKDRYYRTNSYTFEGFSKYISNFTHSNNFKEDIIPLVNKSISMSIDEITEHNKQVFANIEKG